MTDLASVPALSFSVCGSPVGEPRSQPTRAGGRLRMHRNSSADEWKLAVRSAAIAALGLQTAPRQAFFAENEPLLVVMTFLIERPKNHFRLARGKPTEFLAAGAPIYHTAKPDADNLAKGAMDALAGWPKGADPILWWDDAQVVEVRSRKEWASNENQPGLWIEVHRIG